jgi:hypothetical protein
VQGDLSKWRIGEVLGTGAGGPVHAVVHREDGRRGALKRARPGDDEAAERMRAEIAVLTGVSHPNLVALLDAGEAEGVPWLVLERMEESAATRLLHADTLAAAEIVTLGAQVLDALAALHLAGVVHRDVKPANVLRDADGTWRLADLGSARTAASTLTQTGSALGTPAFMAPEQRHGARHVGPAADLYALGATLWCLARGEVPFELHADDASAWRGLPHGLAEVIRVATRLQPEARWSSAQAMREALIHGAGDPATPLPDLQGPASAPAGGAPVSGRRTLAALGLVGGLALALKGLGPWGSRPPAAKPDRHVTHGVALLNVGPREGARFGASLAADADVGFGPEDDVAIGMPGEDVGGGVALRYDGCCDVGTSTLLTERPYLDFGTAVALVARRDGESHGGIVVGGPHGDGYVEPGGVPMTGQAFFKEDLTSSYGRVLQRFVPHAHGEAGTAVLAWRDPDEDGLRVAYGAPGAAMAEGGEAGAVIVMRGVRQQGPFAHVHVLEGDEAAARVGAALVHADLDGDGHDEVIVGAPGARGGRGCVRAFTLDIPEGTAPFHAGLDLGCGELGEAYGSALATAGDLDGDGRDEVWIGAPGGEGRVLRVDLGGVRTELRAELPGAGFGSVLHARPDLRGDLWVGAPADKEGRVWAFATLDDGVHDIGEAEFVLRGAEVGGSFGAAIAVHRDASGAGMLLVGAPGELEGAGRVWGGG